MNTKPDTAVERLLRTLYEKLRQHEPLPPVVYRIGLIALSALLTYFGIDIGDVLDDDES
jgi:hypothetical protein